MFLIAAGLFLFAHAMFDASLEWRPRWRPFALVGAGGWLVDRHRHTNRTARVGTLTSDKSAA